MFHKDRLERLQKQIHELQEAVSVLDLILFRVINHLALSATLRIEGDSLMPATLNVGKGATAVYTEFSGANGTGSVVAPAATPVFASSDSAVATVDQLGNVLAVGVGTATISASDSGNGLSASDTVTVLAGSATLVVTAN